MEQKTAEEFKNKIYDLLKQSDTCFGDCDTVKECTHTGHGCSLWMKYTDEIFSLLEPYIKQQQEIAVEKALEMASEKGETMPHCTDCMMPYCDTCYDIIDKQSILSLKPEILKELEK